MYDASSAASFFSVYKTTRSRRQAQRQADYQNEHAPCTPLLSDRSDMLEAGGLQNERTPLAPLSPLSDSYDGQAARASPLTASCPWLARGRHGVGDHVQASAL